MQLGARSLAVTSYLLILPALAACPSGPLVPADTDGSSSGDPVDTSGSLDTETTSPSTGPESTSTGLDGTQTDTTGLEGSATETGETSTSGTETGETETETGPEPTCGDGNLDPGEACDDGGESPTCDVDCTPTECGDGVVNATAGEFCDDAGESPTCDADCSSGGCGDGTLNVFAGELCDDGGESPTCNFDCTPAACGDGIFNASAGESCDEAGRTAACNPDCTLAECGDGLLNVLAGESCDDGGESASCNSDCSLSSCGDGITNLTSGEGCDDAGPSVGCDADCTAALCGDLVLNPVAGEECEVDELSGATCQTLGFVVGTLACGGGCSYDTGGCIDLPAPPELTLDLSQVKHFDFSWPAVAGADHYQLLESATPGDPFVQLGSDVVGESLSLAMPLHLRHQASYVLRACNLVGCTDSAVVDVVGSLAAAVGYVKASNTDANDVFGTSVALSDDGSTLAVGATGERSNASGIDGDQADDSSNGAGAVYVFVRDPLGQWTQQAYVKASNPAAFDNFGFVVALSDDGSTLAVGAPYEDSIATGINGNETLDFSASSGAAYVFARDGAGQWSQQAFVKASNTGAEDLFGTDVTLSGDGNTLAVGAIWEDSNATGIGGNQGNNSAGYAGAAYVYVRNGAGFWSQQAYVKASNTGASDYYGTGIALDDDGNTLAVAGPWESSAATGVGGNQADESAQLAGAVYVYVRNGAGVWSQQAYLKASNTEAYDRFGLSLALSGDGDTLAAGAFAENSGSTGVGGDQAAGSVSLAGAAYVFGRDGAGVWSQQAYVKATNTGAEDRFGDALALSGDGDVLAVSAYYEDSGAIGIGGNQADGSALDAGVVYVLVRDDMGQWSHRAYVKAPNTGASDQFGSDVALSGDGHVLAVGARLESGSTTGLGGDQADNGAGGAGAVYLY
jgi:hypothetical protein